MKYTTMLLLMPRNNISLDLSLGMLRGLYIEVTFQLKNVGIFRAGHMVENLQIGSYFCDKKIRKCFLSKEIPYIINHRRI